MSVPLTISSVTRMGSIAALFAGVALLVHILVGASLLLSLFLTAFCSAVAVAWLYRVSPVPVRATMLRRAATGAFAGLLATTVYDVTRFLLSRSESLPYNPFEAITVFGTNLVGSGASPVAVFAAGAAFHTLNGVSFGVSFVLLFRRPGVLAGVAWGLLLESFQLALYPGWLNIRAVQEFMQISAISHLAYGASLGFIAERGANWTFLQTNGEGEC